MRTKLLRRVRKSQNRRKNNAISEIIITCSKDAIDVAEGGEVTAVHFEDGSHKADVINADTGSGSKVDEITFDADSFSVYGVLYSVDFIYEGYKYSMEGEDSILLNELAERLELYEKDYEITETATGFDTDWTADPEKRPVRV